MSQTPRFAHKITELGQIESPFFQVSARIAQLPSSPETCDFAFGNPHDMPLPGYVAALQKWSVPNSKDYYAYVSGEDHAKKVIAKSLSDRFGRPYAADDILMTNGACGSLRSCFNAWSRREMKCYTCFRPVFTNMG